MEVNQPRCWHRGCINTMGFPAPDGGHVCWLHSLDYPSGEFRYVQPVGLFPQPGERMKCYNHPDRDATHTDAAIDFSKSTDINVVYKRVGLCASCAHERREVATNRIEVIIQPSEENQ